MSAPALLTPVVRWAAEADLPAALACYARNGYGGNIRAGDGVLVAERDGGVVGVVRLVDENGIRMLRGMFLDAAERRRGLGSRMLRMLAERIGPVPCWLICKQHLLDFYGRVGFRLVAESETAPHLAARAKQYERDHGPQVVLRRP